MNATAISASLALLALAGASHGADDPDSEPLTAPSLADGDFRVYWSKGLRFDTPDKQFRLKLGGRIMNDWGWFSGDDLEDATGVSMDDGTEFRRARLYLAGLIYGNVGFKAQYDFARTDPDDGAQFKDVYLDFHDFPLGTWRVGHFFEPFGLEQNTSSKYITFMERSTVTEAFAPERNSGLMVRNTALEESMTWAVGYFRDTNGVGFDRGEGGAVTGRVTYAPVYKDDGSEVVHLGLAASVRDADDNTARFRSRPEAHLLDRVLDTGAFSADGDDRVGLEAAWVHDAFSLQGEYMMAMVDSDVGDDPDYSGYYVQASWFATGEHRAYKRSSGTFDRVSPKENRGQNGGSGAVELALRYSNTDVDDGAIAGEQEENISLGCNWHLNPNVRIMGNVIQADFDEADEDATFFTIRFQVDF